MEPFASAHVSAEMVDFLIGSLTPDNSIYQVPESSHGSVPSVSAFLEGFSAFFGFGSNPSCIPFTDKVSDLIARQVQVQLAIQFTFSSRMLSAFSSQFGRGSY